MPTETFAIVVRIWHDPQHDAECLRIVRVDTNDTVPLNDGAFLVRLFTDESATGERCLIRHLASGREAYVQGGPNLRTFIRDCVLPQPPGANDTAATPPAP